MTDTLRRVARGPFLFLLAVGLILIGLGSFVKSNTVAFFTATTVNPGNTFSTQSITFSNAPNGGAACTSGPGTTNNPQTACGSLVTLANTVPGSSKFGRVQLSNTAGAGQADVTLWLTTTATASSALDTTAVTSGGLGLLMFRCYSAATGAGSVSTAADCNTAPGAGNALYLLPVYPAASATPCGALTGGTAADQAGTARPTLELAANTALSASLISSDQATSNNSVRVTGAAGNVTCTGGNVVTANAPVGGPSVVSGVGVTGTAQARGLAAGASDFLAAVTYLPTSAGNPLQGLTSTLEFSWQAEQKAGTSS